MTLIKEFRIVMPYNMQEYKRGQRYSTARLSNESTTGKEGIELKESSPYTDPNTGATGVYTFKLYHLGHYVPKWLRKVIPANALILEERAWDCYPHCKTVVSSPFFGEKFEFVIESQHAEDKGEQENIHKLDKSLLSKRKVVFLDIAKEQLTDKSLHKESEDPSKVVPQKAADRFDGQPLSDGWQNKVKPVMCAYKLVTVRCKIWGLQDKLESFLMSQEHQLFLRFHKQIFCWMNDWFDLTMEEVIEQETKMFKEAENKLANKPNDPTTDNNNSPAEDDGSDEEDNIVIEKDPSGKESDDDPEEEKQQ